MARRQMVTRRCKTTVYTFNAYELATKEIKPIELDFPKVLKKVPSINVLNNALKKKYGDGYRILDLVSTNYTVDMRAMWLDDFLANSFSIGK